MEKAKIKNIIIIILLAMNISLLFIVISGAADSARSERLKYETLLEIIEARSITLSADIELKDAVPAEISLKRNPGREQEMLDAILGKNTISDMGGDIYLYSGGLGLAKFHSDGVFELLDDSASIDMGKDPVESAISVLKKMGISCTAEGALVLEDKEATNVTLFCTYKGSVVFSSSITCTFIHEKLWMIRGQRLLDDAVSVTTPENYPDLATIIMKFLSHVDSSRDVFTRITAVDLGYFAQSPQVGVYTLRPVWRICTDVDIFYFDGFTGEAVYPES